jgi:hypothetical protein
MKRERAFGMGLILFLGAVSLDLIGFIDLVLVLPELVVLASSAISTALLIIKG